MTCSWTGKYTYQPNTSDKNDYDRVCDAIVECVEEDGAKHNMQIITKKDHSSWYRHGKPITVDCYYLKSGNEEMPIEEVAESIIAYYESYMEDESSNFGENACYIGEPWSAEDLEVFTRESMIEYWN